MSECVPTIVELSSTVTLFQVETLLVAYCREPEESDPL